MHIAFVLASAGVLVTTNAAAVVNHQDIPLGISWPKDAPHEKRQINTVPKLPILNLGYQKFQAAKYNFRNDIYKFKNIRFAAAPTGKLRWQKPQPPPISKDLGTGDENRQCLSAPIQVFTSRAMPVGEPNEVLNSVIDKYISPFLQKGTEDCLFLDVYIPGVIARTPAPRKVPVIVWFTGGAYIIGSKDVYDGSALLEAAKGKAIFVAANYRLGAYGWLGGPTVEKEGVVNAGLFDQRAALQWVQEYIHLAGGDRAEVSAWGESAGAGSLMHHLVLDGGKTDPLFKRAILQSPAFSPTWDTEVAVENSTQRFLSLVGCAGKGLACARAADEDLLHYANNITNLEAPGGGFAYGPFPDGKHIRQLPAVEFAQGHYWKGLQSIIVSHVSDEALFFVPKTIETDEQVNAFLNAQAPPDVYSASTSSKLLELYPAVSTEQGAKIFETPAKRVNAIIRDSSFTCNNRWIARAYAGKSYSMQYSGTPGIHGIDLIPTFFNLKIPMWLSYRAYFTSHALTGNPNTYRIKADNSADANYFGSAGIPGLPTGESIKWPISKIGSVVTNVLNFKNNGYELIDDGTTKKANCDFWEAMQTEGMQIAKKRAAAAARPGLATAEPVPVAPPMAPAPVAPPQAPLPPAAVPQAPPAPLAIAGMGPM